MLALYRSGRQADALHAYQEARRTLLDQLGIEPGPALQRLHGEILRQDRSLEHTSVRPAASDAVEEVAAVLLAGRLLPVLGSRSATWRSSSRSGSTLRPRRVAS